MVPELRHYTFTRVSCLSSTLESVILKYMSLVASLPQSTAGVNPVSFKRDFVSAWKQTTVTSPFLFTSVEKKRLGIACLSVFILPLVIGSVAVNRIKPATQLHASLASLQGQKLEAAKTNPLPQDELALADYFIEKARQLSTDTSPAAADQMRSYLSQAQTQVDRSGATPEAKSAQVAALNDLSGTKQQIAAPAPEVKTAAAVSAKTKTNSKQGTALLKAGTDSLFVEYPALKDDTQIYLVPDSTSQNVVVYVKSKEAGKGFTLATTGAVAADLSLTWYEINQ